MEADMKNLTVNMPDGSCATLIAEPGNDGWFAAYFQKHSDGGSIRSGKWDATRDGAIEKLIALIHAECVSMNATIAAYYQARIDALEKRLAEVENPAVNAAQEALDDARYTARIREIGSDNYYTNGYAKADADKISALTANLIAAKQKAQVAA